MKIEIRRIGLIHSPYKKLEDIPCGLKQESAVGEIEVFKEYEEGLKEIEGFSHLKILWYLHESEGYSLQVKSSFDDDMDLGIFATDHPNRPNSLALTVVELIERKENILKVKGVDMLDKTPVIDIKPYTSLDRIEKIRIGWLSKHIR